MEGDHSGAAAEDGPNSISLQADTSLTHFTAGQGNGVLN